MRNKIDKVRNEIMKRREVIAARKDVLALIFFLILYLFWSSGSIAVLENYTKNNKTSQKGKTRLALKLREGFLNCRYTFKMHDSL